MIENAMGYDAFENPVSKEEQLKLPAADGKSVKHPIVISKDRLE